MKYPSRLAVCVLATAALISAGKFVMAGEEPRSPREISVPVTGDPQYSSKEKVDQEFNGGQEDQDGGNEAPVDEEIHRHSIDDPDDPMPEEFEAETAKKSKEKHFDLTDLVLQKEFWTLNQENLIEKSGKIFGMTLLRNEVMCYSGGHSLVEIFGFKVEESVANFEGEHIKRLYAVVAYAEQEKDIGNVRSALPKIKESMETKLGRPAKVDEFKFPNGRRIKMMEWEIPAARISLRWNEEVPGAFVSILVERADLPDVPMIRRFSVKKESFSEALQFSVSKEKMKILALPMRVQLKGIGACWSTTIARQLDYLGSEIEPQMAAEMVGGSEDKYFHETCGKLGTYHLTYNLFSRNESGENAVALLKEYNALAEKDGAAPIKFEDKEDKIVYADNFKDMKNSIVEKTRLVDHAKYKLFRHVVISSIDNGIPVGWSVVRWTYKKKKGGGKHRRMIVGYDLDNDLIYFSDPWGFACEKRTMCFRAAYAMTSWMELLGPSWIPQSSFPEEPKERKKKNKRKK